MSNFKNFSKSVKKSLCVLASASSIFSILPTAMAMGGENHIFSEQKEQKESFVKLMKYFLDNGREYIISLLTNEKMVDIDKKVSELEDKYGVRMYDETKGYKDYHDYREHKMNVHRRMFEYDRIANCRVGASAILLKAKELNLKAEWVDVLKCDEENKFNTKENQSMHSFVVVMFNNEEYVFDISNVTAYYYALYCYLKNNNNNNNREYTYLRGVLNYAISNSIISIGSFSIRNPFAPIKNLDEYIKSCPKSFSEKFTHSLREGEDYKKINYNKKGDVVGLSEITPGEEVIFKLQN